MKKKRGISLIVLIITLVVILIIVAIIVLNLKNTDPVGKANEVKLRSDFKSLNEEFLATISDLSMSNSSFTKEDINISARNVNKMRLYIPSITQEYANKLFIKNGNLLYIKQNDSGYNENEEKIVKELGIKVPYGIIGDADGDGEITNDDLLAIGNITAELASVESDRQQEACDVNADGVINIDDYTELQTYLKMDFAHVTSNIGKEVK